VPCRYLRTVGWQEWICAISGASVGDRCGIGLEECIPLLAWRWVRGEVTFARITRGLGPRDITRRAVIAMAQRILEREGVPLDLQQMSEAELGDLAGPAAALRVAAPHRGAGEAGDGGDAMPETVICLGEVIRFPGMPFAVGPAGECRICGAIDLAVVLMTFESDADVIIERGANGRLLGICEPCIDRKVAEEKEQGP